MPKLNQSKAMITWFYVELDHSGVFISATGTKTREASPPPSSSVAAPRPLGCPTPAPSQPSQPSHRARDLRLAGGAHVVPDRGAAGTAAKAVGWTAAGAGGLVTSRNIPVNIIVFMGENRFNLNVEWLYQVISLFRFMSFAWLITTKNHSDVD